MSKKGENYSLLSQDIIHKLKSKKHFVRSISYTYNLIGLSFGTNFELSQNRLMEACEYWQEDVARTLRRGMPNKTESLDHFKHASFIVFWLRRTNPINTTFGDRDWLNHRGANERARREEFFRYANEICALKVGMLICLFYESRQAFDNATIGHVSHREMSRHDWINSISMPDGFLNECAMILKHKTMSPYALYMFYKSLFTNLFSRPDWTLGS